MKELRLNPSLATSLASGHPWVYRDHVGDAALSSGSWVKVIAGSFSALGLWDADSQIAIRIFSTTQIPDAKWVRERVAEAWDLRRSLRESGVTGYRLIFGEADGLPGVVLDVYGSFGVLVSYSKSLGALLNPIAEAAMDVGRLEGVVRRSKQDGEVKLQLLKGRAPPDEIIVLEHGMHLLARLNAGQKTGLFFDHRENRAFVRKAAEGARVLNLFSYSGGFSVAAALGGAVRVTSVDIAAPAVADSVRNFAENGLQDFPHDAICADVFQYLESAARRGDTFDLVVCDPPSFARNRTQLKAAEKAYRKVMSAALRVTARGGIFCAASCTSQVGPQAFRHAINDSARKERVRFQVIHEAGQPIDHPVLSGHEEGRYLKFVAGRVLSRF